MELPLWSALRDLVRAVCANSGARFATAVATMALSLVASGFIVLAGFVLLMPLLGVPGTALAFGALFAGLAIAVHALGRHGSRKHPHKAKVGCDKHEGKRAALC